MFFYKIKFLNLKENQNIDSKGAAFLLDCRDKIENLQFDDLLQGQFDDLLQGKS